MNDNLIADIRRQISMTLAAGAESIFRIMRFPNLVICQSANAMEEWKILIIVHCLVLLRFIFNTRRMLIGVTDDFRHEVLNLLKKHWYCGREAFGAPKIEKLVRKLSRIGQGYRPLYHLVPHLYASVAYALRHNEKKRYL